MIKANELRIGNLVLPQHDLDGKYHLVKKLEAGLTNDYIEEWYSPITLTPEILERCGFERIDHIHGYTFYTLSKSRKNRCHIDIYPEKTQWMSYTMSHCKYLHQLQNLYFTLTGQELEIKELQKPDVKTPGQS